MHGTGLPALKFQRTEGTVAIILMAAGFIHTNASDDFWCGKEGSQLIYTREYSDPTASLRLQYWVLTQSGRCSSP